MALVAVYAATAMLLVPMIFIAAECAGHGKLPGGPRRFLYSVLAALMWPVLVLGAVQFAMILTARHVAHVHPIVVAPSPVDEPHNSPLLTVHA